MPPSTQEASRQKAWPASSSASALGRGRDRPPGMAPGMAERGGIAPGIPIPPWLGVPPGIPIPTGGGRLRRMGGSGASWLGLGLGLGL